MIRRRVLSVFYIVSFARDFRVYCHGTSRSASPGWPVGTSLLKQEGQSQVSIKGNSYDVLRKFDFAWSERVEIIFIFRCGV